MSFSPCDVQRYNTSSFVGLNYLDSNGMTADKSTLGVVVAPASPAAANPLPRVGAVAAGAAAAGAAGSWPRSTQLALAVLLALASGLLAWHAYGMQRWGSRPTTLDSSEILLKLDLNRADRAQLLQLPGVGDNLARRIEAYRLEHHGFNSVEDLRHVSGIGPTMLERLRPFVYVEPVQDDENDEKASRTSFYNAAPPPPARMPPPTTGEKKTITKKSDGLKELVNINEATVSELQHLPGVGPKLAARIVEAREKKPFRKVDDLRQVPGIGPKTMENLRPHVTADTSPPTEKQQ